MKRPGLSSRAWLLVAALLAILAGPAEAGPKLRIKGRAVAAVADFPGAPASITSPVVGTSLIDVWNLQKTGATGPRYAFTNGTWSGSIDAYLTSKGCVAGTYDDIVCVIPDNTAVVVEKYDFTGAPALVFYGNNITVTLSDDYFPTGAVWYVGEDPLSVVINADANRNLQATQVVNAVIQYCDFNVSTISIGGSTTDIELHHNRIRGQKQAFAFGGGEGVTHKVGINFHHNFVTGVGVNSPTDAHIEMWQHILGVSGSGSYAYLDSNVFSYVDGQATTTSNAGWTGDVSEGGEAELRITNNIRRGVIYANTNSSIPNRIGAFIAYHDSNVTAGFTFENNAIEGGNISGTGPVYTYKHQAGETLKPTPSGNRTFRDSLSDGIPGYPNDNVEITSSDLN